MTTSTDVVRPAGEVPAGRAGVPSRPRRRAVPWFKVLSLAPLLVFLVLFGAYPIVELVRMALSDLTLRQGQFLWDFTGLANFVAALDDAVFATSLQNSAVFITTTTALTLVLGLLLALLTDRAAVLQRAARNVMLWPAILAPVVVSVIWLLILNPQVGVLNKILTALGLPEQGWLGLPTGAMASVILVDVWHWTPLVYLICYTALKGIDPSLYDAARVDGAGELQLLRRVTIPLLRPALLVAAGIRVIMGVKVFDEMFLLTHGGPGTATTVVSIYIRNVFFGDVALGYGAALSVLVVLLVLATLVAGTGTRRLVRLGAAARRTRRAAP